MTRAQGHTLRSCLLNPILFSFGPAMAPETSSSADKRIVVVDPQKPSPLIAPAGGASMGALLTLLVKDRPDGDFIKDICLIAAPILAVVASAFWHWFLKIMKAKQIESSYLRRIEQFKIHLQHDLDDPRLSEEQKKRLQLQYDKLSEFQADFHWRKLLAITTDQEFVSLYSELEKRMGEE